MKVLHVLFELQFSGAELMLHTAHENLNASGQEITILATGPKEGVFGSYFKDLGWNVVHIPFKKSVGFFKELYQFIRTAKFDVVHIHTEGAFIYIAGIARLAGAKSVVSTVHNNFNFKGYLKWRRQLHHLFALKLLRVKFISISESVRQNEKEVYFTDTTLVHNWIDVNKFLNKSKRAANYACAVEQLAEVRLISVGKCLVEKQHSQVLLLLQELIKRGVDCHYMHIGCGDLEATEKQWVADHGLNEAVTFVSHTHQVADYMAACNYYIMPSLFEGVGNACLEAMAAGLFCIVNDAPGLNTLIKNNETGIITTFSNIGAVADQLLHIHKNPELFQTITANAQQYVIQKHSIDNVEQMIEMYQY